MICPKETEGAGNRSEMGGVGAYCEYHFLFLCYNQTMAETGATIEQEIAQLEKQLQEKKANLEQQPEQKELPSDKETLREVVGEKIQQHAPTYIPKPVSPQAQTDGGASYLVGELKDKVQELVNHVFQNSLEQGIKEAVKSNNPALIDAFHDVLVDQLYDALLERKKVDPIT